MRLQGLRQIDPADDPANYDTVIRTTSYAYNAAQVAQALAAAATAAANVAQAQAAAGATQAVITAVAQAAARQTWSDVTGSAEGYEENAITIMQEAVRYLSYLNPVTAGNAFQSAGYTEAVKRNAVAALQAAAPLGLGALFGGSAAILIGGAVLLVILLAKR